MLPLRTVSTLVLCCGVFAAAAVSAVDFPVNIAVAPVVGKLNGDANLDFVVGNQNNILIFLGNGAGGFTQQSIPGRADVTCLANFNNDTALDLAVADTSDTVRVYFNNGLGAFPSSTPIAFPLNSQIRGLSVGDLNNDGKADLAAVGVSTVFTVLGNGAGGFAAPVQANSQVASVLQSQILDIDKDGNMDLLTIVTTDAVQVYPGDGAGRLSGPFAYVAGQFPVGGTFADFNGDGSTDAITCNFDSGDVTTLLGDGLGGFQSPVPFSAGAIPRDADAADFNQDGKPDLMIAASNSIVLLLGNGAGAFGSQRLAATTGTPFYVAAGDFNNDGTSDIVSAGNSNISVILLNPPALATKITPDAAPVGAAGMTITVTGSRFFSTSVVQWNGKARPTTFVSATELRADISAADLALAGRAMVAVSNPSPGGFPSAPVSFFVHSGALGEWRVSNTLDQGQGSLRFALDSCRNGDRIVFDADIFSLTQSETATLINVESELPPLDDGAVSILAMDNRVTINGSAAGTAFGLRVESSGNIIQGLSLIGFTKSGIGIRNGAKNNAVGGSRAVGTGPNGQGLRIADCGAFGVEITGAGTSGNTVKGCWIGLDISGELPAPNLSGMLIQDGASANVIGSTVAAEQNYMGGNQFEGITVSGAGTDDNVIIGNRVGLTAVESSALASSREESDPFLPARGARNGASGIFLSRGTKRTRLGGTAPGEGNIVGFSGRSGVEIRAAGSRFNAARSNRISRNRGGGIALFDGSNDGVPAPVIGTAAFTQGAGASTRAARMARVTGAIPADSGGVLRSGTIELFSDPEMQGSTLLGRGTVTAGTFTLDVPVDPELTMTGVFTDATDNTSAFAPFGGAFTDPFGGGGGGSTNGNDVDGDGIVNGDDPDADNDGFPNNIENVLGLNPLDPASKPESDGTPSSLTVLKFALKLDFAKDSADGVTFSGTLPVPDGTVTKGATAVLDLGGYGKGLSTTEFKLARPKGGVSKYTVKLSKQGLKSSLANDGFTAASPGSKTLAIHLLYGGELYGATRSVAFVVKRTVGSAK